MKREIPEWLVTLLLLGLYAGRIWLAPVPGPAAEATGVPWRSLLALFEFLDLNVENGARYAAMLFGAASLALAVTAARLLHADGIGGFVPAFLLAASPVFAGDVASAGGAALFQCAVAATLVLYLFADSRPRWYLAFFAAGLVCSTSRWDGAVFVAVLVAHRLLLALLRDHRRPPRPLLIGAVGFAIGEAVFLARHSLPRPSLLPVETLEPFARASWALYVTPLIPLALVCRRGTRQFVTVTAALPCAALFVLTDPPPSLWIVALLASVGLQTAARLFKRNRGVG